MIKIILSFLLILIPTISYSHSQLTEILPRENVVYSKTPPEIKLKFRSQVKLVKINLNKINDKNQKINLNLDSFTQRSKEFAIPMPKISSGKYNILWRALSPDGHIIKGKSEFEVK
tara:strand:+ start:359 stop:706 length:348 start_codon:yes stop_codon:yes gene_type:complete